MNNREKTSHSSATKSRTGFFSSRRRFLSFAGSGLFFTAATGFLTAFSAHSPKKSTVKSNSVPENTVTKSKPKNIFIVRTGNSFKAVSIA